MANKERIDVFLPRLTYTRVQQDALARDIKPSEWLRSIVFEYYRFQDAQGVKPEPLLPSGALAPKSSYSVEELNIMGQQSRPVAPPPKKLTTEKLEETKAWLATPDGQEYLQGVANNILGATEARRYLEINGLSHMLPVPELQTVIDDLLENGPDVEDDMAAEEEKQKQQK